MCNQAAGLSRCLTKVQDSLEVTLGSKGPFHKLCSVQCRISQDLSEGVFISMANLTLACRDSYLEFIGGGVKPDTLTALRTS